jgi:hypothetical protein
MNFGRFIFLNVFLLATLVASGQKDTAYGINTGFYGKEMPGQKRFVISPGETLILEVTLNKLSH